MITASKVALARACPVAFALPHRDERHPGQDEGDDRHADLESDVNAGAIPDVLTERWPEHTWRSEVTYAIDLSTGEGRELGQGLHRDYRAASVFEIVGTADLVGSGPSLVIVDRKSFDPNVPRADVNPQLHTLALAATRTMKLDECEIAIWHEVRPFDVHKLERFDLDLFAHELREIAVGAATAADRFKRGEIAPTTGSHCRYCPAFNDCPSQRDLMSLVKQDQIAIRAENGGLPLADDKDAADAYELRNRLRMLLKRIDASLYARANERPIPLANGKLFGPCTTQGNESIDGDIAYEVLREKHGQPIADAAVERKATKSGIKSALAFVGAKSVAAAEREVLAEIRKRGGATRKTKTEICEYDPQPRLVAVGDE